MKVSRRWLLGGGAALALAVADPSYSYSQGFFILAQVTPRTFYIAASGNDANPGTQVSPWLTNGKVNSTQMQLGDTFLFNGGDTFTDATLIPNASGTLAHPITFSSYGTGQATVSVSALNALTITNLSNITVSNLNGVGAAGTNQSGFAVVCNTTQSGIMFNGLTVSGFAAHGIFVNAAGGQLSGVSVLGCTSHDNTKLFSTAGGSAGIYLRGTTGAQVSGVYNLHGVLINNCVSHDNPGILGTTNWVGSGICLFQCDSGTIQNCTAYLNGALNNAAAGGPVGIFLFDDKGVVVRGCESYKNNSASGDGDGFDADSGCINCIFEYCYSHGNHGNGFQLFAYTDGVTVTGNSGCIIRYCVSEGDGTGTAGRQGGIALYVSSGAITNAQVYGNTVYGASTTATGGCFAMIGAVTGGFVANNIFYAAGIPFISKDSAVSTIAFTGNDYFSSTGAFSVQWAGTTYTSLATWQAATNQEKIAGANVALTVDPTLLAPGSGGTIYPAALSTLNAYQLLPGSPMIGAGLNLVTQYAVDIGTQDFYGNAISAASLPVGCTASTNTVLTPAQTSIARMGAINYTHRQAFSDYINGLVSANLWSGFDVHGVVATQSASAAVIDIKTGNTYVLHPGGASPVFVADRGYTGVDSSATVYIDTLFNPTVGNPQYTQDNGHAGVWVETNVTSGAAGGAILGSVGPGATAPFSQIWPKYNTGVAFLGVNSSPASAGIAVASSVGDLLVTRSMEVGVSTVRGYKDTTDLGLANTPSAAPLNQNFYVLAKNNGGSPSAGSGAQASIFSIGRGFTPAEVTAFHNLKRAYMTAVGAP